MVFWVFDELSIFEVFTSFVIQNGGDNEGIGSFIGTCGLCNIGEHEEVDTGFGITGCHKSAGMSAEGNGLTKAWGIRDVWGLLSGVTWC